MFPSRAAWMLLAFAFALATGCRSTDAPVDRVESVPAPESRERFAGVTGERSRTEADSQEADSPSDNAPAEDATSRASGISQESDAASIADRQASVPESDGSGWSPTGNLSGQPGSPERIMFLSAGHTASAPAPAPAAPASGSASEEEQKEELAPPPPDPGSPDVPYEDRETLSNNTDSPAERDPADVPKLRSEDVVASVLSSFPLVRSAALQFDVAQGQVLSAEGAFDLKLKGESANEPLGFYETYRHEVGAVQPLANGGRVFGGYRIGRGFFEPWFKERQTDDGGEFKAGLSVPLARNVRIDARRAGVRKAAIDLASADPRFRSQVIETIRDGLESYWQWVAANAQQEVAEEVLGLATTRQDGLKEEVEAGAKAPPVLKDNRRAILSREAKLIDARRKLIQSAAKLSIYLRTPTGERRLAATEEAPVFPDPEEPDAEMLTRLSQQALQLRPELQDLDLSIDRVDVQIAQAGNDLLPNVDAVLIGSQDIGEPASPKEDKSEFELEASLRVDVPLQRRKARGKLASLEAKRAQLLQKRRLIEDKVRTDVETAFAALEAAYQRVRRTTEARELAAYMADVESEKLAAGASDLLSVVLREQQAAEAAGTAVEAHLEYQTARAALRAAAGVDDGSLIDWSPLD